MPKGVVSVGTYLSENVKVMSSGLHPGGTFQSKNTRRRLGEPDWLVN
jgi:hypothetical protein